jgi:hypothetical protein
MECIAADVSRSGIYRRRKTQKLRNIEQGARVALHLNGDAKGDGIVIFNGDARIDDRMPLH